MKESYLVFKIVPPIWPRFFDTSLFLDNSFSDDGAKNTKGHSDTVIIIAMNTNAVLQLIDRLSDDFESIIKFDCINPKLGYRAKQSAFQY